MLVNKIVHRITNIIPFVIRVWIPYMERDLRDQKQLTENLQREKNLDTGAYCISQ